MENTHVNHCHSTIFPLTRSFIFMDLQLAMFDDTQGYPCGDPSIPVLLGQRCSLIFRKMLNQFLSDGRQIDPATTGYQRMPAINHWWFSHLTELYKILVNADHHPVSGVEHRHMHENHHPDHVFCHVLSIQTAWFCPAVDILRLISSNYGTFLRVTPARARCNPPLKTTCIRPQMNKSGK